MLKHDGAYVHFALGAVKKKTIAAQTSATTQRLYNLKDARRRRKLYALYCGCTIAG